MVAGKFKEVSKYHDFVVRVFLILGIIGVSGSVIYELFFKTYDIQKIVGYFSIAIIFSFLYWWIDRLELKLSINSKRIKYKMAPFHNKPRRIIWDDISQVEIIKSPKSNRWFGDNLNFVGEKFYSLQGRNGLSILKKDGERIFLGCKNIKFLKSMIESIEK